MDRTEFIQKLEMTATLVKTLKQTYPEMVVEPMVVVIFDDNDSTPLIIDSDPLPEFSPHSLRDLMYTLGCIVRNQGRMEPRPEQLARDAKPIAVGLIVEGWIGKPGPLRPRLQPNRSEAIIVSAKWGFKGEDPDPYFALYPFAVSDGELKWAEAKHRDADSKVEAVVLDAFWDGYLSDAEVDTEVLAATTWPTKAQNPKPKGWV